jgi:hypothetical protein
MTTPTPTTPPDTFDTTPTEDDVAAAKDLWASTIAECHGLGLVDFHRYLRAQRVAIELGVAIRGLVAIDKPSARFAARAQAMFEEWMKS